MTMTHFLPRSIAILRRLLRQVGSSRAALQALRQAAAPPGDLDVIRDWLYQHRYLEPADASAAEGSRPPHPNLPAALRAALPASTRWLPGWTALETGPHGACVAARRGQARELRCGEYVNMSARAFPSCRATASR